MIGEALALAVIATAGLLILSVLVFVLLMVWRAMGFV